MCASARRRGLTLVEMLVAVALLVLMMTVIVTIFSAATGAVSTAKTYQQLDGQLRQLDSVVRNDLANVTATMSPPIDPTANQGYFEYGENQFADLQNEDSDDYLKFTTKAPEGELFTGRMYMAPPGGWANFGALSVAQQNTFLASQPITINSQFAEVVYFLRNGNLYRRVFLIVPERQASLTIGRNTGGGYSLPSVGNVSWLGLNDVSVRPISSSTSSVPILNTLGSLTNRENRAFSPRFSNDYTINSSGAAGSDGIADDSNLDGVNDYYPTLYPGVFSIYQANDSSNPFLYNLPNVNSGNPPAWSGGTGLDAMAFPYIFPGAYSQFDATASATTIGGASYSTLTAPPSSTPVTGSIHGLLPDGQWLTGGAANTSPSVAPYGYYYYLYPGNGVTNAGLPAPAGAGFPVTVRPNHASLDAPGSDNLVTPMYPTVPSPVDAYAHTWWGFPTWRETMSANWLDPIWQLPSNVVMGQANQSPGLSWINLTPLTPMDTVLDFQPFNDQSGEAVKTTTNTTSLFSGASPFSVPALVFRDDLLMTGVRSFDVKAYDPMAVTYVDLGYSNLLTGFTNTVGSVTLSTGASFTYPSTLDSTTTTLQIAQNITKNSFGHEGRIPPLFEDYRIDKYSQVGYPGNLIGDDRAGVIRLRRVFDTWSQDYLKNAPKSGIVIGTVNNMSSMQLGNPQYYPSFPPPYEASLRGLQVQIRVVDPSSQRIKVLTIRQDFSDKIQPNNAN